MNVSTTSVDWLYNSIRHKTRQKKLALPLPTLRPKKAQGCFKFFQNNPLTPLDSSPNELRGKKMKQNSQYIRAWPLLQCFWAGIRLRVIPNNFVSFSL